MKNILILFLLLMSGFSHGQGSAALNVIDDAVDVVDLALEADHLVASVNGVLLKHAAVQRQIKTLDDFMKNPKTAQFISKNSSDDILLQIQWRTIEIDMYGNLLLDILKGIRKQLTKHAAAATAKEVLSATQIADQLRNAFSNKVNAMGGTTDLSGTQTSTSMFSSHAEFRAQMEDAIDYLEKLTPKVMKVDKRLTEVMSEMARVNSALTGSVATQMFLVGSWTNRN